MLGLRYLGLIGLTAEDGTSALPCLLPSLFPITNRLSWVRVIDSDCSSESKNVFIAFGTVFLVLKNVVIRLAFGEVRSPHFQNANDSHVKGITRPVPFGVFDFPTVTNLPARSICFHFRAVLLEEIPSTQGGVRAYVGIWAQPAEPEWRPSTAYLWKRFGNAKAGWRF